MKNVNYRRLWEKFHNTKIPKGYHVHHVDGNKNNNDISNLQVLSPSEHTEAHRKLGHKINDKFIVNPHYWDNLTESERTIIRRRISEKVRGKNKGRKHTLQSKQNMSKAHIGLTLGKSISKPRSIEYREKMRIAKTGVTQSITTREKRRQTALRNKINHRGKHALSKRVICTATNKVWECVKDVSEELNINYVTLKQFLQNPRTKTKYHKLLSLRYVNSLHSHHL